LTPFETVDRMREYYPRETVTKYPLRLLRYWFVRHLLEAHASKMGRPLDVLEVGVDRGQMLTFMGGSRAKTLPALVRRWDAVDIAADPDALAARGYTHYEPFDVDNGAHPPLSRRYDAIIFLHLLEHLRDPERCLRAFLAFLRPDGILTGGSPTMPKLVADFGYERLLARRAHRYAHVSVISPERVERFGEAEGLTIEFLSGSFIVRSSGSIIENSALWLRLNVAFGSFFPSLGSEVYFSMSRASSTVTSS
jgi:2-polyprenyl-3-methyl-5-hydroxy-6-metoxy-1,4-benzoquinol methylase